MRKIFFLAMILMASYACSNSTSNLNQSADSGMKMSGMSSHPSSLKSIIKADWRMDKDKARDKFRKPYETLAFFEVEPSDTIVEIWPGGGWYTSILGPYLHRGGGKLIAAGFDPLGGDFFANAVSKFNESYIEKPETYGNIEVSVFSATCPPFAKEGSVDKVLTFRNVHNWMANGFTDKFFKDAYDALKPGGILGVVEHRLPSTAEQDPRATSGYVHEDFVKALAKNAGFTFAGSTEINANPLDTADHPFGVWTLPPVSRTKSRSGDTVPNFDAAKYMSIGESDRMTLKFVKPKN